MSQRFSLYGDLTVDENLFLAGAVRRAGARFRDRKAVVLDMAGLEGRERELAGNLSGGWHQRLALGAAILHEPELLFLDEPTAGVDPVSRRQFWDLLYSLPGRADDLRDHALHGRGRALPLPGFHSRPQIVAQGTPEEIKETQMRGQVLEIDCEAIDRALPALQRLGGFDEIALYGALIHVVAEGIADGLPQPRKQRSPRPA